jgi:hypothetical protein
MEIKYQPKKRLGKQSIAQGKQQIICVFVKNMQIFLNKAKTEREAVRETVSLARENGFVELEETSRLKKRRQGLCWLTKKGGIACGYRQRYGGGHEYNSRARLTARGLI